MTTVNPQITDAVTQANVKVLGESPAMAMGALYQTVARSVAIAVQNAVVAQQQSFITAQAAATMGVAKILSTPPEPDAARKAVADATVAVGAAIPPPDLGSSADVAASLGGLGEDTADAVAHDVRTMAAAAAASLEALGAATASTLLRIVQIGATSACFAAMVAQPEKVSSYEQILALTKRSV